MKRKGIKQIKHYRLTNYLISDLNPNLYEAIDDNHGTKYIVYSVAKNSLDDEELFHTNFKKYSILKHHNISALRGFEKTNNNYYFIYEYSHNSILLRDFLKQQKKLSLEEIQIVIIQLSQSLNYLFSKQEFFCDIRSHQIILLTNKQSGKIESLKYLNLSFESQINDEKIFRTVFGKSYGSLNNDNVYKGKIELFSIGAIAYELLTGLYPLLYPNEVNNYSEYVRNHELNEINACEEIIDFINSLISFKDLKINNIDDVLKHPFLSNDPSTFHDQKLIVNFEGRDFDVTSDNYLWRYYQPIKPIQKELDKVNNEINQDILDFNHDPENVDLIENINNIESEVNNKLELKEVENFDYNSCENKLKINEEPKVEENINLDEENLDLNYEENEELNHKDGESAKVEVNEIDFNKKDNEPSTKYVEREANFAANIKNFEPEKLEEKNVIIVDKKIINILEQYANVESEIIHEHQKDKADHYNVQSNNLINNEHIIIENEVNTSLDWEILENNENVEINGSLENVEIIENFFEKLRI